MSKAALARASKKFPSLVVQELADIEGRLGGRQQIVGMLALAPLTPDLRYVLGLLGDPQHRTKSLAEVCALGNILPGDLLKQLGSAALLKGKVEASQKIGDGIAAVAEDVMRRAAPYEDTCNGGCRGTGSVTPEPTPDKPNPSPEVCETCLGTGKLRYQPDLERQKLAIEMAQLLPKSGGIQIAQINGAAPGGGQLAIDRLQELTDRILYGPAGGEDEGDGVEGEIEAEVLDPDPADPADPAGGSADPAGPLRTEEGAE